MAACRVSVSKTGELTAIWKDCEMLVPIETAFVFSEENSGSGTKTYGFCMDNTGDGYGFHCGMVNGDGVGVEHDTSGSGYKWAL